MPTKTNNILFFEAYLYSVGTQHGNLYQLSVTTSRVSDFIVRAHIWNRC